MNQAGIDLIKHFEGCKLKAYRDQVGILTIGFGHIADVYDGQVITQDEADQLLQDDLKRFCDGVTALVSVDLNDNQFAALVSFVYNLGLHALAGSTLLKLVNQSDFDNAVNEFKKWDHAGGKISQGLLTRRNAEADLFSS